MFMCSWCAAGCAASVVIPWDLCVHTCMHYPPGACCSACAEAGGQLVEAGPPRVGPINPHQILSSLAGTFA